MMKEDDRSRVFWLLKKYSSYTAWKALGDAFQAFTDAWETAVRNEKPEDQDEFIVEALKNFWKGCDAFDKGLALLKRGDRFIFRNKGNWIIEHEIEYARRLMDPNEYVHDWMVTKDEAYKANELTQEYKKFFWITEKPDQSLPATFDTETVFWTLTRPRHLDYSQFNFPSVLPEVPAPTKTTVDSGKEVPVDGIWEPEWPDPDARKRVVIRMPSLFSPSIPSHVRKGCMNYLIGGTIAPPYQDSADQPVMPVRWRLVWEDRRYRDGVIPAEEADYLAPTSSPTAALPPGTAPSRVEAGRPCPQRGFWFTPAQQHSRRFFQQDEIMPEIGNASYGATIWQWDTNQDASKL